MEITSRGNVPLEIHSQQYDLKMRLAVRLAAQITEILRHRDRYGAHNKDQLNLIFDALADGLGGRTEDELLSLISIEGE